MPQYQQRAPATMQQTPFTFEFPEGKSVARTCGVCKKPVSKKKILCPVCRSAYHLTCTIGNESNPRVVIPQCCRKTICGILPKGTITLSGEYHAQLVSELTSTVKYELRSNIRDAVKYHLRDEFKSELKAELKSELRDELKFELKDDFKSEVRNELKSELRESFRDFKRDILKELSDLRESVADLQSPKKVSDSQVRTLSHDISLVSVRLEDMEKSTCDKIMKVADDVTDIRLAMSKHNLGNLDSASASTSSAAMTEQCLNWIEDRITRIGNAVGLGTPEAEGRDD